MKGFIQNSIIAFLMILAVYQASELWFGDFSNHNFFSFSLNNDEQISEVESSLLVESVLINPGNNKLIEDNGGELSSDFDKAIALCVEKGSLISMEKASWKELLKEKCVIYELGIGLRGDELADIFAMPDANLSKMESFRRIVIVPKTSSTESMRVYFITENENNAYTFELKKSDIASDCLSHITEAISEGESIYYISGEQNGFDIFNKNEFIPRWSGKGAGYYPLIVQNPFITAGNTEIDKAVLERAVDVFFDLPANKWDRQEENAFVFSDESTVVRYNSTGVLEYSGYKTESVEADSIIEKLSVALSFLNKDTGIENNLYLSGHRVENDKEVFCFDYKINGFNIGLSSELKEKIGMDSFIEITVSEGRVEKYKRYAVNLSVDGIKAIAETDFLDAVDSIYAESFSEAEGEIPRVEKIKLSYIVGEEKSSRLSWVVDIMGESYIKSS